MLTRREFLQTGVAAAGLLASGASPQPKRLAIIATIYKYLSHAQHIGDRFLVGYPYAGAWHKPDMKVVSLYVDQKPEGDLSAARASEFGFQVYPTIAEALCCGGKELAVDAVLIVAEHGDYPRNEKGQILYPRYEFFQQCVEVFKRSGRSVPVYNDKHLSYSFAKAKSMVDASRRLGFPMLGGSSIPVTFRLPNLELPLGCEIEEALMVGEGGSDPMDFHALEGLQCMVERRGRGETGVKAVQLIEGDAVWKAGEEGRYSKDLLVSAFSRSDTPMGPGRGGRPNAGPCIDRPVAEACGQPRRVFHRVPRRLEGHAVDARRRAKGFQLRCAFEGIAGDSSFAVLPDSQPQRDLFCLPGARNRADVPDACGAVPN